MFAFVCPIRHPQTASDYNEVVRFLEITITSVCNQKTSESFIFLIVCNQKPNIKVPDKRVQFLVVDYPPPDQSKGSEVPLERVKYDKGTKTAVGLLALRQYNPDYVHFIDGDDWLDVNLIESIKDKTADLWYANSGYSINYQQKTYIKKYGVVRYCGSTLIFNYHKLMQLTGLNSIEKVSPTLVEIESQVDEFVLKNILGNHRHQIHFFKSRNLTVKEIPITSVCWLLNTGQNHTGNNGGSVGKAITMKLIKKFGVSKFETSLISHNKIKFSNQIKATIDSVKSLGGWLIANKSSEKI